MQIILANWMITGNTTDSWERVTNASSPNLSPIDNGENTASFRIRSLEFDDAGETHSLITPGIDLSDLNPPVRAYFDLAYAKRSGNTNDLLEVHVVTIVVELGPEGGIENVMKILMIYLLMVAATLYSHILHQVLTGNNKV